jgi:phosphatidate cytidylyltransferase
MLSERIVIIITFLPIGFAAFIMGGWSLTAVLLFLCLIAAWEYAKLFEPLGFRAPASLVVLGVGVLIVSRQLGGFEQSPQIVSLLILLLMAYHLVSYERGCEQAGTNFNISLGGIFYIGWLGAYFISLRALPDGMWWICLVMICIWIADSMAYFFGTRWGRHPLAPRLSPKKTWEGYFGSIVGGLFAGLVLGWIIQQVAPPWTKINIWQAGLVGLLMGVLPTLGDLGESMIKRQVHAKDSGNTIPGHGGFFDRIDSWLWAGVIAYYTIVWFF